MIVKINSLIHRNEFMNKFYIENRIWYVGYTWINLDSKNIKTYAAEHKDKFETFKAGSFGSNNYINESNGDSELLYLSYSAKHLRGLFKTEHYDSEKTFLEFKFLTNGCVNVILTLIPKDPSNFAERVKHIDAEGAGTTVSFNDDILSLLVPKLQDFVSNGIIECHDLSLWGIPALLSEEKLDLNNIEAFAKEPKTMHGRKTLYWSVLYVQNIISDDPADRANFDGVREELVVNKTLKDSPARESFTCLIGNGKMYWEGNENEKEDVLCFLEGESVLLSRTTIMSVSIDYNTELSLILLKDEEMSAKVSVDKLRKPIALLRTHLACSEMFVPNFSEEVLDFYERYNKLESEWIRDRMVQQKEAEETLLQIANITVITKNETHAEWFQFFLVTISALTIFSVIQDAASFVLYDDSSNTISQREFLFGIVLVSVTVMIYFNSPWKFTHFKNLFKKIFRLNK